MLVRFHRMLLSRALALSASISYARIVPASVHSGGFEPTKFILLGAKTTYKATGDAAWVGVNRLPPQLIVSRDLKALYYNIYIYIYITYCC